MVYIDAFWLWPCWSYLWLLVQDTADDDVVDGSNEHDLSLSLSNYIYTSQTTLVQSKPLTFSPQTIIHDTSWSRDLIFSGDPLNESVCPDYSRLIVETHSSVGSSCIEESRNDWLLFHVLGCVKLVDLNDRVNNTLGMMTFNSLLNVLS